MKYLTKRPRGTTTDALGETVIPGWTEDLEALDAETTKLLADARAEPRRRPRKKQQPPEPAKEPRSSGYGAAPAKEKKKKRKAAASLTPPRKASGDRLVSTSELKPKHASSSFFDAPTKPPAPAPRRAAAPEDESSPPEAPETRAEAEARAMAFGAEEERIRDGSDSYVPSVGVRLQHLANERERLAVIARANAERAVQRAYATSERAARSHRLKEDLAAQMVQRIYRGKLGQRSFRLEKDEKELAAEIETRWVEVCDRASGESWYFNTMTRQSRWDAPDALAGVVPDPSETVTLPPLRPPMPSKESDTGRPTSSSLAEQRELVLSPRGASFDESRRRRGREYSVVPKSRRRRGRDVDISRVNRGDGRGAEPTSKSPRGTKSRPRAGERIETSRRPRGEDDDTAQARACVELEQPPPEEGTRVDHLKQALERRPHVVPSLQAYVGGTSSERPAAEARPRANPPDPGGALYEGEGDGSDPVRGRRPSRGALVLPDGTFSKAGLRDAVAETLRTHKFDSAHTLMMAQREDLKREASFLEFATETGVANQDAREPLGARRDQMAAISVLDKNREAAARRQQKRANKYKWEDKTLALRHVGHDAFRKDETDVVPDDPKQLLLAEEGEAPPAPDFSGPPQKICFNCWSSGRQNCKMHASEDADGSVKKASESALMCQNWNLEDLERRYRSEEIQELFQKSVSSLRYDQERKTFVATVEQKHPIYRAVFHHVAKCNFTMRRKLHTRVWIASLVEELRCGKIKVKGAVDSGKMLRLRNTLMNGVFVRGFTRKTRHRRPPAPVTGTTLPEKSGAVVYLIKERSSDEHYAYVVSPPVPYPVQLFEPTVYPLPAPRTIPLPEPTYSNDAAPLARNRHIPETHAVAWFERFSAATGRDAVNAALAQVHTLAPVAGMALLRRTKYPSPHTVKFATFARKPTPGNRAVGGLAAELTVYQLVQAVVPPQFGNFSVMERQGIVSEISPEITAVFPTYPCAPVAQHFVDRALEHVLNYRVPPTVVVATAVLRSDRHHFGTNRPAQTGEVEDRGFRTSAHAAGYECIVVTATLLESFTPSNDIAAPNAPAANTTNTTHVDHTYPFCEPSSRNNTTLDFYHLLLVDHCSPNKEQVFTNLGVQQCGQFMHRCDRGAPLGQFVSLIYRSWAFVQRNLFEEYRTDDGIAYWYNRRTGETFWERPLADCEKLSVMDGGVRVDYLDDTRDPKCPVEQRPTHEVRSLILKHHEEPDDVKERREKVAYEITQARDKGSLPPPEAADPVKKRKRATLEELSAKNRAVKKGPSAGTQTKTEPAVPAGVVVGQPTPPASADSGPEVPHLSLGSRPGTAASDKARPRTASFADETPSAAAPVQPSQASAADAMASSIAAALLPAIQNGSANAMDLLKLGLGLGMGLGAANADAFRPPSPPRPGTAGSRATTWSASDGGIDMTDPGPEGRMAPEAVENARRRQSEAAMLGVPIGVPNTTTCNPEAESLPHDDEFRAQSLAAQEGSEPLTTTDVFQGVAKVELSAPPDEERPPPVVFLGDRKIDIEGTLPVVAHPQAHLEREALARGFSTHAVAGLGTTFVADGTGDGQRYISSEIHKNSLLRRSAEPLPEGFFQAIHATHVGTAQVDYLPWIPNLPQARPIGRIKPRPAAEDWLAVGFDPWSAGKDPLGVEFIGALAAKAEKVLEQAPSKADESFIDVMDRHGLAAQEAEAAQANKMSDDFEQLASWARHSRYRDIENAMNQPDWLLPVDYQDELGNTLLSIAVQNGNKRIAKLCLRRGANINLPNNTGQTVLHYAYAYGFEDLAEYMKSKGADDRPKNADGLTCYEGLSMEEIEQI